MSDGEWLMCVENGLSAHFKEESGASRPGVHWAIDIKRGQESYKVLVKALLRDEATTATRRDKEYQAQTAMQYLNDQLQSGWHPSQVKEHTIYIGNPHSTSDAKVVPRPERPWWKLW